MGRPVAKKPSDLEMNLLNVLWNRGPCTVREVMNAVNAHRDTPLGYTTFLKVLQGSLLTKKFVRRLPKMRGQAHVYAARLSQRRAQRQLIAQLWRGLNSPSVPAFLGDVLTRRRLTPAEFAQIRHVIDAYEARLVQKKA